MTLKQIKETLELLTEEELNVELTFSQFITFINVCDSRIPRYSLSSELQVEGIYVNAKN